MRKHPILEKTLLIKAFQQRELVSQTFGRSHKQIYNIQHTTYHAKLETANYGAPTTMCKTNFIKNELL